jgi:2-amino-4-hydroxy-6-hydroxymethyldihydropteridine diphosphokinase
VGREVPVVVAFGSNLGDRRRAILDAAGQVGRLFPPFTLSPLIETAPVGDGLEGDPAYLNAVGVGTTSLTPRAILDALRDIEAAAGRTRPYRGAPRTLDLDLILAGDAVVEEGDLQVPHPRFRERLFVLDPLARIAPDLVDPVTRLSIRQLRDRVRKEGA